MVRTTEIEQALIAAFPGAEVRVADTTGGGDHFEVRIAAGQFAGQGLLEQHRMIYGALGALMPRIHALQLHTEVLA
jgi:stress-induced morphogen